MVGNATQSTVAINNNIDNSTKDVIKQSQSVLMEDTKVDPCQVEAPADIRAYLGREDTTDDIVPPYMKLHFFVFDFFFCLFCMQFCNLKLRDFFLYAFLFRFKIKKSQCLGARRYVFDYPSDDEEDLPPKMPLLSAGSQNKVPTMPEVKIENTAQSQF